MGSSPRGRGKHLILRLSHIHRGLIPARAGKTAVAAIRADATPAHPRAGGENVVSATLPVGSPGSSPRGRGKRTLGSGAGFSLRLIPARAGKTPRPSPEPSTPRAHPRAGGENGMMVEAPKPGAGSSPRGRGKLRRCTGRARRLRLIPARAGKTPSALGSPQPPPAHPRAGGENVAAWTEQDRADGSSPRGRGKPTISVFWVPLYGLIPARAGKTYPRNSGHRRSRAHPRAGGENKLAMNVSHSSQGSSPRGRGKPRPRGWGKSPFRLIPARAGKTSRPPVAW